FDRIWTELSRDSVTLQTAIAIGIARPIGIEPLVSLVSEGPYTESQGHAAIAALDDLNLVSVEGGLLDVSAPLRQILLGLVIKNQPTMIDTVLAWWIQSLVKRSQAAGSRSTWSEVFSQLDGLRLELFGAFRWAARSSDQGVKERAGDLL